MVPTTDEKGRGNQSIQYIRGIGHAWSLARCPTLYPYTWIWFGLFMRDGLDCHFDLDWLPFDLATRVAWPTIGRRGGGSNNSRKMVYPIIPQIFPPSLNIHPFGKHTYWRIQSFGHRWGILVPLGNLEHYNESKVTITRVTYGLELG